MNTRDLKRARKAVAELQRTVSAVDLVMARQSKEALAAAATAPGVDPERTARYLSGDLEGFPVDSRGDVHVRVPAALIERADALLVVAKTEAPPEAFGWRKPNRTALIRLALARGLEELEREYSEGEA